MTNDDTPLPALSITDVTMAEGNAGLTAFVFTVNLSAPSAQTVTVDVSVGAGTASAGSDYQAPVSTMLTFTPGDVSESFTVQVLGDTEFELNETFLVSMSNAVNATLADAQGTGTIQNEDAQAVAGNAVPVPTLGDWHKLFLMLMVLSAGLMVSHRRLR
ncbi:MAG: hypothetical protein IPK97_04870 [Ahniella sp.]|nr:hypothetical protein [Ahniella sp.]